MKNTDSNIFNTPLANVFWQYDVSCIQNNILQIYCIIISFELANATQIPVECHNQHFTHIKYLDFATIKTNISPSSEFPPFLLGAISATSWSLDTLIFLLLSKLDFEYILHAACDCACVVSQLFIPPSNYHILCCLLRMLWLWPSATSLLSLWLSSHNYLDFAQ